MKKQLGILLMIIGVTGLILSSIIFGLSEDNIFSDYNDIISIASFLLISVFVFIYFIGKRMYRIEVFKYKNDSRPPILYLRNFDKDKITTKGKMSWLEKINFWGGKINLKTEEEEIAMAFEMYGPFIAIGKPDELLPRLGADRLYVNHSDWQQKVRELIKEATLIVMQPGSTPGLIWELQTVIETKSLHKLVLLVPENEKDLEAFRDFFKEHTSILLPFIYYSKKVMHIFATMHTFRGVIWFSESGAHYNTYIKDTDLFSTLMYLLKYNTRFYRHTAAVDMRNILQPLINNLQLHSTTAKTASSYLRWKATALDYIILTPTLVVIYFILPEKVSLFNQLQALKIIKLEDDFRSYVCFLIYCFYFFFFEAIPPFATYGKRLVKIYVGDKTGMETSWFQVGLRNSLKAITFLFIFGFYYVLKNKELLHDKYSETSVFVK
jgi:uncharacterized RDD family membrane protein YckC